MQYEVEHCNLAMLAQELLTERQSFNLPHVDKMIKTATGRAAMYHVLRYLKQTKVIANKNTPVYVPQWLCISFLQLMRKHCAPTIINSQAVKAVVVYHQYGFPQNMDEITDYCARKKIVIIEDCANLVTGYYKDKPLGSFGLAAIYSFSKLFPSIWGGALTTNNEELYQLALKEQKTLHSKLASFILHLSKYKIDQHKNKPAKFWNTVNMMAYGTAEYAQYMYKISENIIASQLQNDALTQRQENYLTLLELCKNEPYFQHLETTGVIPFIAPLIAPEEKLAQIVQTLIANGYSSGIYSFDINRNLFNPNFVKCAWVPIHQGLTQTDINKIAELIMAIKG